MSLTEDIKQKAIELGFDLVGITDSAPIDTQQAEVFSDWLKSGYAGQMNYMRENFDKRTCPAKLLKGAKSVICVGLNYRPQTTSGSIPPGAGRIASYALYEDYHEFIKKLLYKLADFIGSVAGKKFKFKVCVDSAPIAERALAARARLGFIGKNHMLINPELGSQILLGELLLDLKLQTDESMKNQCSDCNKCLSACPAGALGKDGTFCASKCISYLTIEHKGQIRRRLAKKFGNWLFGCDQCILVCPYESRAPVCSNRDFRFYDGRQWLDLQDVLNWDSNDFGKKFAGSAIQRLGLDRFKRNARICLKNIGLEAGYGAKKVSASHSGTSKP